MTFAQSMDLVSYLSRGDLTPAQRLRGLRLLDNYITSSTTRAAGTPSREAIPGPEPDEGAQRTAAPGPKGGAGQSPKPDNTMNTETEEPHTGLEEHVHLDCVGGHIDGESRALAPGDETYTTREGGFVYVYTVEADALGDYLEYCGRLAAPGRQLEGGSCE